MLYLNGGFEFWPHFNIGTQCMPISCKIANFMGNQIKNVLQYTQYT